MTTDALELWRDSPDAQRLEEQRREKKLAQRRAWAAELVRLDAAHLAHSQQLQATRDRARGVWETAQRKAQEAESAYGTAVQAVSSASNRYDSERGRIERELRVSCSLGLIDGFLDELAAMLEASRTALETDEIRTGWPKRETIHRTNADSVKAHAAGVRRARQQTEDLRLVAIDDVDLAEQLMKIREAIPLIERLSVEVEA